MVPGCLFWALVSLYRWKQLKGLVTQVAGLKHYEALKLRIPREECSAIAGVVTEAVQRLFAWPTQGSSPAHIRAMGSFVRGKPATSVCALLYKDNAWSFYAAQSIWVHQMPSQLLLLMGKL